MENRDEKGVRRPDRAPTFRLSAFPFGVVGRVVVRRRRGILARLFPTQFGRSCNGAIQRRRLFLSRMAFFG